MNEEEREKAAMAMHLWMADRADELGASYEAVAWAWTGEFREDGVLIPREGSRGFSIVLAYFLDGAVRILTSGGLISHQLFYSAERALYAVVETVWDEAPYPPAAFPVGKPHPDGTAPLRWVGEGESDGTSMVAWASDDVPCPRSCRTYPGDCTTPYEWMTEQEVRELLPHLFREEEGE